jgi:tetratricopeptide (TPR) repeat protein
MSQTKQKINKSTSINTNTTSTAANGSSNSSSPSLLALHRIDELAELAQKNGNLLESLSLMEKSLILRGSLFGLDSEEMYIACKSVAEMCNYLAMTYLQGEQFEISLELLKKAEILTEKHNIVRAVTFNNLACYYRKKAKLRTALNYCTKALLIEQKLGQNISQSSLND